MNGLPYALEQFLLSFSLMDIELHVDKSFSISFSNTHTCEHTHALRNRYLLYEFLH